MPVIFTFPGHFSGTHFWLSQTASTSIKWVPETRSWESKVHKVLPICHSYFRRKILRIQLIKKVKKYWHSTWSEHGGKLAHLQCHISDNGSFTTSCVGQWLIYKILFRTMAHLQNLASDNGPFTVSCFRNWNSLALWSVSGLERILMKGIVFWRRGRGWSVWKWTGNIKNNFETDNLCDGPWWDFHSAKASHISIKHSSNDKMMILEGKAPLIRTKHRSNYMMIIWPRSRMTLKSDTEK